MNPTNSQNALALLAQQKLGQLPAAFRGAAGKLNEDMSSGISAGFAIVSFRGKAWRVKHRGEEKVLLNEDGVTPRYSIDVVIMKASPNISKVWYEFGYVEGSTAPPDCWSVDGRAPDPASPKRQNPTCAGCRWNAWGSSRSTAGSGKGKDCADSKRLAIVPLQDIDNEMHGGPMMLRVPPASLGDVLTYANGLEQMGFPYYAVGTSISFDVNAEYPKLMFKPLRALTDEEAEKIAALRDGPMVDRIISAAVEAVHTDGVDTTHVEPAAPPVAATPAPTFAHARPAPQTVTVAPPPATPKPAVATPQGDDMRAKMRAMGLTEEQIVAALGPEPKPEPKPEPVDPRIGQLKAMGLSDEQIAAMLAVPAQPAAGAPAQVQAPAAEPKKRGPKPKPKPKPETNGPQPEPQPPTTNGGPPEVAAAAPEQGGDLPAGFDDMLESIIASSATKQ